jgi:hypothetical protein
MVTRKAQPFFYVTASYNQLTLVLAFRKSYRYFLFSFEPRWSVSRWSRGMHADERAILLLAIRFFSSLNGATLLLLSSNTNIQFKRRLNFAQPLKNSIDHIAFSIMEGSLLKRLDLYGRAYMFVVLASFNKKRKTQLIFIKFVCLVAEGVPNSWQFICSLPFCANSDPHDRRLRRT